MASSDNSVQPKLTSITPTSTIAVKLNSSSLQVAMFSVSNPNASNAIYLGDSTVASNKYLAKITSGQTFTVGPIKIVQNQTQHLDLGSFYVRATSASQSAVLTTYIKGITGGAF